MSLRSTISSLFRRTPARSVILSGIGNFTEGQRGHWHGVTQFALSGENLGVLFKTAGEPPGDEEAKLWQQIVRDWPGLWSAAVTSLRRDLEFDSGEAETSFFADLRPNGCVFEILSPGNPEAWAICVDPEYSNHQLLVSMVGLSYNGYELDG